MICTVCEASAISLVDSVLGVYRCSECTHEFTLLAADKNESYSSEYFLETHKNWFLHPDMSLYDAVIKRLDKKHGKILDIGCGKGSFLKRFREKNPAVELYGIDLIENQHESIHFIQEDFLAFKTDLKFDVITGFMVVEHVNDPSAFIEKVSSLLAPNGIMILNTINSAGLMYSAANILKQLVWRGPYDRLYSHHHLQHYSIASLKKLAMKHGFEVLEHKDHNFPLSAVDVPRGNIFLAAIYKIGIASMFGLTSLMGRGVNQTIFCKKP